MNKIQKTMKHLINNIFTNSPKEVKVVDLSKSPSSSLEESLNLNINYDLLNKVIRIKEVRDIENQFKEQPIKLGMGIEKTYTNKNMTDEEIKNWSEKSWKHYVINEVRKYKTI